MHEFQDRVAVVTGGASGIGRAMARRFASEGMRVVVSDVEPGSLQETVRELESTGAKAVGVVTDVSQADSVRELADRTLEAFGGVHVLCNNAGVFAGGLTWEAPVSDYEWILGVNTFGIIHGIRTFVPILLEQGEPGHVVNTASMAAVTSSPLSGAYNMSKHAALAISESLYLELQMKQAPIGVSVVCPELISTRIGQADRNRPTHLKRGDGPLSSDTEMVEAAIQTATAGGDPPEVIADRTLEAIREQRFYVLAPEGNPWRDACNARLEDIRLGRNPGQHVTGE